YAGTASVPWTWIHQSKAEPNSSCASASPLAFRDVVCARTRAVARAQASRAAPGAHGALPDLRLRPARHARALSGMRASDNAEGGMLNAERKRRAKSA